MYARKFEIGTPVIRHNANHITNSTLDKGATQMEGFGVGNGLN